MDQRTYNNKSNNVMSKSMFAETDEMKDGMLEIYVETEIPDDMKEKVIDIK